MDINDKLKEIENYEVNDYHGWADGVKYIDFLWLLETVKQQQNEIKRLEWEIGGM